MARNRYKGKVFTVYSLFILIFIFFDWVGSSLWSTGLGALWHGGS